MATKPSSNPPPATLDEVGAAKWAELVSRLAARSRTPVGLGKLEIYCAAYSRWVAAQAWLAEHGDVMEIASDKGVVVKALVIESPTTAPPHPTLRSSRRSPAPPAAR